MALFDFLKRNKEKERFLKNKARKSSVQKSGLISDSEKKAGVKQGAEENIAEKKIDFKLDALTLRAPHITEKSGVMSEAGVYVFKVAPKANKIMVKRAIQKLYGAKVSKVNILNSPSKTVFLRGKRGWKSGFKKAVVYLQKGEKIEM